MPNELEQQQAVAAALKILDPKSAYVLHLRYWQGATFQEIAQAIGCSVNQARGRVGAAQRLILRRCPYLELEMQADSPNG